MQSNELKKDEVEEVEEEEEELETDTGENEIFTPDQLLEKWSDYALSIKDTSMRMYIALKNREPKLKEGFKVVVKMDNGALVEDFNRDVKVALTGFLRRSLNNNLVEIVTVIEESEITAKKVYTDADKFNFLSKKTPALLKLKNDLNLDFE